MRFDPVATTTPAVLPGWGPRSAPGSVLSGGLACDQIITFLSLYRVLTPSGKQGLRLAPGSKPSLTGALPNEAVSKLSRLKAKKIRPIATQYRAGSGSDRILDSTVG